MHSESDTHVHLLTVNGLSPDTDYQFRATSHGTPAAVTHNYLQERVQAFTTLQQLRGTQKGYIVVANDVHMGEIKDGLWFGNFPPPAEPDPSDPPYPETCQRAVIMGAAAVGASRLFVNSDLTSEARPMEVACARELLKMFPGVTRTTRGNHDRPHVPNDTSNYQTCSLVEGTHHDCYGDALEPWQQAWEMDIPGKGVRVIGIDSTDLDHSGEIIHEAQFQQIEAMLTRAPQKDTIILLHHPATRDAAWSNPAEPIFVLRDQDIMRLQDMVARAPGVRLVLNGHTHRARRNRPDVETSAVFLECASAKNWPTGATHIRIFDGGLAVNFQHNRGEDALDWASRTRWTQCGPATRLWQASGGAVAS